VAELEGDAPPFFDVLRRTHSEGEKRVIVRREKAEGSSMAKFIEITIGTPTSSPD